MPGADSNVAVARADASAAVPEGRATFALPTVRAVLDDPRLVEVQTFELARDHADAARAMEAAHDALGASNLADSDEREWQYVTGHLYLAASEPASAAKAFDRASAVASADASATDGAALALIPYANLRAAEAYAKAGDAKLAEQRARAVSDDIALADEAHLLLANALDDEQNAPEAVPLWRALLAKSSKTWIDVACRLATALLEGADGPPESHAVEALDLATRVVVEAPKIAISSGAEALRLRALGRLPAKDARARAELRPEERVRRARAWLDAGEATKALAEATAVIASLPKPAAGSVACSASIVRAQSTPRAQAPSRSKLPSSADAWSLAIAACAHDDALVTALFNGAKASSAKEPQIAMDRYGEVERLFPSHRLADDARFQGALVALGQGDEERFSSRMLSLPDDYPQGDMRGEALFRVALLRMTHGDWTGAVELLDRIVGLFPDDRHWATAGRAAYFRARMDERLGHAEDAMRRYAGVIESEPLTFYMAQAYARLASFDAARARETLDRAMAKEPEGSLLTHDHPELARPGLLRGLRLLEVGEVDAAKREIDASGVAGDGAEPEALWALAFLYDRASAPEIGHAFARSRLTDYLAHYPSGRWRAMWEVAYPRAYSLLVETQSRARSIPSALTWAIMREESDFYPDAKSSSNAFGLMQLIVPTARGVAVGTGYGIDESQLKRPDVSIALGTKLLGGLRSQFAFNPPLAIAAYNGGAGAVGRWLAARGEQDFDLWVEQIPWDETRGYIKRVLSSEAAYAMLYDRAALEEVLGIPERASGVVRATDAGGD
jgi:soluble lytic murein transglycosylase